MLPSQEKALFEIMTKIHCKGQHHKTHSILCTSCQEMVVYAWDRIDHCPHGAKKPFCSKCTIHCFQPLFRERVKTMMRYSGPRMIFYAPKVALQHFFKLPRGEKI